jgi:hypothetical protein
VDAQGRLMATLPAQDSTIARIYRAIGAAEPDERRPHLGASLIGHECLRYLWYVFRWCESREVSGRLLRLFRRGRLEEEQLSADLARAGIEIVAHDEHGRQYSFSDIGGHAGGSMDGAALGLIEAPKTWHVLEYKTHSSRSFAQLARDGVEKTKPEHHAQMMLYMHWSGMKRAYYLAVNKDTDDLYGERIHYDAVRAGALVERARQVIAASRPLPRLSEKPEYYACKMCRARSVCHEGRIPEATCRTCLHATPEMDGAARWSCALHKRDLTPAEQGAGCRQHLYIPDLIPVQAINADETHNSVTYRLPNGIEFTNGPKGEMSYPSSELAALPISMIGDLVVRFLRRDMDAEVIA